MGMVVRTNVMSMNANRSLGINNSNVGKSLEKLSSGFRINRAADDASGLAISEKMKAQIKGLEQASANSQDGISLIQTAEGATQEIHNMLNRMTELATKSANGTIQDDVDREAIQKEVNDLKSEITRIADATDFNGIKLLNGNLSGPATVSTEAGTDAVPTAAKVTGIKITTALTGDATVTVNGKSYDLAAVGGGGTPADQTTALAAAINADGTQNASTVVESDGTITLTADTAGTGTTLTAATYNAGSGTAGGDAGTVAAGTDGTATGAITTLDFTGKTGSDVIGNTITVDGSTYEFVATGDSASGTNTAIEVGTSADATAIASAADSALSLSNGSSSASGAELDIVSTATGASATALGVTMTGGLSLQIGATNDTQNSVSVQVADLTSTGLGIESLDVSSQKTAGDSIQTIKDAINTVSTNRANLGSLQNRLEYTINNLDTTAENMTAANSRVRDTDMAKEMMNYTKNNILTQAAQAMLAQANQQPQAILQLLQ